MELLKKENWKIWLLMLIFTSGMSNICLGAMLDIFDKNAWYMKGKIWLLGFLLFIIPGLVMICAVNIEYLTKVCAKLNVNGKEFYLSPYIWIILLIIPIIGWIIFIVLFLYLNIMIIVKLYQGEGEKYIKNI